jgi:hypothetical protein
MSDHRQLKRQVRGLLSGLGTGQDEVADSLHRAGVSGVPKDNRSCAVALYVGAVMGSDPRIRSIRVGHCSVLIDIATVDTAVDLGAVGTEGIATAAPCAWRPAGRMLVQLPKPVRQFVAAFDARRYPAVTRGTAQGPPAEVAAAR